MEGPVKNGLNKEYDVCTEVMKKVKMKELNANPQSQKALHTYIHVVCINICFN